MSSSEDGLFGDSLAVDGLVGVQNENDPFSIQPLTVTEIALPGDDLTVNPPLLPVENGEIFSTNIDELFDPEYYLNSNADLGLAGLTTPE